TIVKTRIIARQQQVVRVDRERRLRAPKPVHESVVRRLELLLPQVERVICEDYGKGFLTQDFVDQVGAMIAKTGKVFTADPNPGNPLRWTGVTTIKPNRAEDF